jgi:hypothetical protein
MGGAAFVKIFGVELVIKICVGLVRIAGASRLFGMEHCNHNLSWGGEND